MNGWHSLVGDDVRVPKLLKQANFAKDLEKIGVRLPNGNLLHGKMS